jgi:hypothetical protein
MKIKHWVSKFLETMSIAAILVIAASCVADSSVAKKRGVVKDFSVVKNANGCDTKYLLYSSPYDSCVTACPAATTTTGGYHLASATELATVKADLTANANTSLLTTVNESANICMPDVLVDTRPTDAIKIDPGFCSCLNGKSDIISSGTCANTCALKTATSVPMLYVTTIPDAAVVNNTKIKNLYGWCSNQLTSDTGNPQCKVVAEDGNNTLTLDPIVTSGSNAFSVNILALAPNKPWILKIVETRSGAVSSTFQVQRQNAATDTEVTGALAVTPINQYTCINWGLSTSSTGVISRDTFARLFYYFGSDETPASRPPATPGVPATVVCHDEIAHPGNDKIENTRLELIPGAFSLWDKNDTRFVAKAENAGKLTINKIIDTRLSEEYGISGSNMNLFFPLNSLNSPNVTTAITMGYLMIPFKNETTGKTYCPTSVEYNGNQPVLNILGEYMDDTEGIYLVEKEAEIIAQGTGTSTTYRTIYGTMLARESTLLNYGFYMENNLKIRITPATMHTKTVHFYWPVSPTNTDALIQGTRRLFTVRTAATLSGGTGGTTTPTNETTTDKRLGCIPKTN